MDNFDAFILGRNMFGPVRGAWPDKSSKGWRGNNPPYHAPTFVLTHYEREPVVIEGGTTVFFVTGGIEKALELSKKAAGSKDVKIGGGVSSAAVSEGWTYRLLAPCIGACPPRPR